ncbi:transcriptional regulator GlxA family with amidase domain [Paraburkholderia caballeronis]|uniref:Transcriptional regulator GlxA family, contains an amidase domain and an AraC-type DNA-binding HTH domain n=2 Tax=Paraburkholderia caballeronis TaxID=416943 RepID=A0A1H7IAY3_9BURK|nr:transcriptional regulator GlxA family with amidase domain [Paraburkholderia caballeronis]PXX04428.1 transcriptional regulator GlxA family with amidase domain [Paraburkholderia caballeronis]RAK05489.1 transcriptional regulator GlxA family with amidase domain [Paraburkholderia caballeronis]TDV18265.1 transcriptional regulator GlxA family with amidase domain [Paraburkholderia caballeronis]TDV20197.1 transcriptional regulator GlxA family with amidase domain [Paraburkholderia caballeronis]
MFRGKSMAYATLDLPVTSGSHIVRGGISREVRHIAILLYDGCSLLGAGIVAEVFHVANELAASGTRNEAYDVCILSADGGNVTCSSSVRVWTDGLDARHYIGFDALFIAGGKGACNAASDERLLAWLRRVHGNTRTIRPIAEGRTLLEAASLCGQRVPRDFGSYAMQSVREDVISDPDDRVDSMKSALALVKRDLGVEIARNVAERLMPDSGGNLMPLLGDALGSDPADKVRAAARWLQENCQRSISISDAAQVAAMSERNFLRRFKLEMGITPSDYLLHARLAITCSLLTDSELPVDKIARRTGMGNGDRLAKIFRKRMMISPTEYRQQSRREAGA